MRILVADDDPVIHAIISGILKPEGHEIISAMDGIQALQTFIESPPDLVLTDYSMPGLNGLELCREINKIKGSALVPIVIFTGAAYPNLLRESLEAGAIEFLTTPFEPDELRIRVNALQKMLDFHRQLAREKTKGDEELVIVQHVLEKLLRPGMRSMPPTFHMETIRTDRISGDACVYGSSVPGVHYGMICDATGYGLMAGVSTIPVVEIFQGMVRKDMALANIYTEISAKLSRILPTGRFVSLLLFRLDTNLGLIMVLNAGIPEALLQRDGTVYRNFPSQNLPAGVPGISEFPVLIDQVEIKAGDRFMAFSDGLVEAFTEEEILRELMEVPGRLSHNGHCSLVQNAIALRIRDCDMRDDISWALWDIPPFTIQKSQSVSAPAVNSHKALLPGMELIFSLDPRFFEPKEILPQIQALLVSQNVPEEYSQILMLLLTESVANAVDHGVLELDSEIKASQGFEAFDALRRSRLSECVGGEVQSAIRLMYDPVQGAVRRINVTVTDSGSGFNWKSLESAKKETGGEELPFGRGIALMRALSSDLSFNERGNRVSFSIDCG